MTEEVSLTWNWKKFSRWGETKSPWRMNPELFYILPHGGTWSIQVPNRCKERWYQYNSFWTKVFGPESVYQADTFRIRSLVLVFVDNNKKYTQNISPLKKWNTCSTFYSMILLCECNRSCLFCGKNLKLQLLMLPPLGEDRRPRRKMKRKKTTMCVSIVSVSGRFGAWKPKCRAPLWSKQPQEETGPVQLEWKLREDSLEAGLEMEGNG